MPSPRALPRLPAALLLLTLAALAAPAAAQVDDDACSFVERSPRYYSLEAALQVAGAGGDVLLSDALLRGVAAAFGLADCQAVLSEGRRCSAGLAGVPCQDPFWLCGSGLVVAASLYEAAASGLCQLGGAAGATATCEALAARPAVAAAVAAGQCQQACLAAPANGTLAPPDPPPSAADACYTYTLQVRTATEEEAVGIALGLKDEELLANLTVAAEAFAQPPNGTVEVFVGKPGAVHDAWGAGSRPGERTCTDVNRGLQLVLCELGSLGRGPGRLCHPPGSCPAQCESGQLWARNCGTEPAHPAPALPAGVTKVVGFGFFPPPPPPSPSPPPPLMELTRSSPPAPAPASPSPGLGASSLNASILYGEWGECSAACGSGWQLRPATCISADGPVLPLAQCAGASDTSTSRPCE